jgi:hypothetical protein
LVLTTRYQGKIINNTVEKASGKWKRHTELEMVSKPPNFLISLPQDMHVVFFDSIFLSQRPNLCQIFTGLQSLRGLGFSVGFGFYKYVVPTALQAARCRTAQRAVPTKKRNGEKMARRRSNPPYKNSVKL